MAQCCVLSFLASLTLSFIYIEFVIIYNYTAYRITSPVLLCAGNVVLCVALSIICPLSVLYHVVVSTEQFGRRFGCFICAPSTDKRNATWSNTSSSASAVAGAHRAPRRAGSRGGGAECGRHVSYVGVG